MIATTANHHHQPEQPDQPAILRWVRLLAQRRSLWLHHVWSNLNIEMSGDLVISEAEVEYLLSDHQGVQTAERDFYHKNLEARQLSDRIQAVESQVAQDKRWQRLLEMFSLSIAERDLLALAIAVAADPSLRRVYGYLQDDATASYATPVLAASLFQWSNWQSFTPLSPLVRWQLAYPIAESRTPWAITTAWVADPAIVTWLILGTGLDPALGRAANLIAPSANIGEFCLYPEQLAEMQTFVQLVLHQRQGISQSRLSLELVGAEGTGKRTLATQLCATLKIPLLAVNAALLLGGSESSPSLASERLMRTVRQAQVSRAALYWYGLEDIPPQIWQPQLELSPLTIFSTSKPIALQHQDSIYRVFSLPSLTPATRIALWQRLTKGQPVPAPIQQWNLTPDEIANAARVAAAGTETVVAMCRQMVYQNPGELFVSLPRPYSWEDIVLAENMRQHLTELEQQVRWRQAVYEQWGFERLCPMGLGITAMFAGPSGTGKTMAAQVLARSLDMELYRIDLAGVVNKYIGETEKRLKQVFDTCERANVMLFFDEADALFGQRTQVKDAHDRYANIQIDYLLQRMEEFNGIAILATNRKGDLDKAFLRRIRFVVDFMQPGVAERLALWKLALPVRSLSGEELLDDINWQFLAERLNMTGANIKSAALSAAFLARAQGSRISMQHILHAAQREMTKHGVTLRPEDWVELISDHRSSVLN
jgi:AAA+ superfamily predicted ATPase